MNNTTTMQTRTRQSDGLTIRYADSDADNGPIILLTSPWPESLLTFRRIWPILATGARLVAIDLPGFGGSQGRTGLFAPDPMAEFLRRLIAEFELGTPHVVAPDVGTGAALFLAARHPESVTSLVVGGGATAYPLEVTGALADIIAAPDIEAFKSMDIRATIGATVEPVAPPRTRARCLGGLRHLLRERPVRRVIPLRPQLPRTTAGAAGPAAGCTNPGTHRQRRSRRPGTAIQRPLPRTAATRQPAVDPGHWSLRLGAGPRPVRRHHRRIGGPRRGTRTARVTGLTSSGGPRHPPDPRRRSALTAAAPTASP